MVRAQTRVCGYPCRISATGAPRGRHPYPGRRRRAGHPPDRQGSARGRGLRGQRRRIGRGRARGAQAPAARSRPARHLDAGSRWHQPAARVERTRRPAVPGHHDERTRYGRDRGRGDPARGLGFHREADRAREVAAGRRTCARSRPPAPRERGSAPPAAAGRADRRERRDADPARADRTSRRARHRRPRARGARHRQGNPRALAARQEPTPRGSVRDRGAGFDRARACRANAVRRRGCERRAVWPHRAGQRRHAVPRRSRRTRCGIAVAPVERARTPRIAALRRPRIDPGRPARDRGERAGSRGTGEGRCVSRGTLLPAQRRAVARAAVARARRGRPGIAALLR